MAALAQHGSAPLQPKKYRGFKISGSPIWASGVMDPKVYSIDGGGWPLLGSSSRGTNFKGGGGHFSVGLGDISLEYLHAGSSSSILLLRSVTAHGDPQGVVEWRDDSGRYSEGYVDEVISPISTSSPSWGPRIQIRYGVMSKASAVRSLG